jgi:hypothetical protein
MLPVSPREQVRATLIASLYKGHRPELADLVQSAGLELDLPGLWITPRETGLSPRWLEEQLWAAVVESGLSFSWIHVVAASGDAWPGAVWPATAV